ncbi:MAG: glutaredoxin 3 [Paracoccaceae bacterium]
MSRIEIYTKPYCPYCHAALALLRSKGVSFEETDISGNPALRQQMIQRAGGRTTVPQVFIGDRHVGGYDDLSALDRAGRLDPLLVA